MSSWWFFRVDTEPQAVAMVRASRAVDRPLATPLEAPRRAPPTKSKAGKRPRKGKAKTKSKAGAKAKAGNADDGELTEMAWARREFRRERREELEQRLEDYASQAGWDHGSTEEVRRLVVDSMERITRQLAMVDNGQVSWQQHKHHVREFRERRADRLKKLLGPDEFADFTDAMGFERFTGEEPPRGRLNRRQPQP
ncbi:MAG: hypothetical protein KTR31_29960 [Myxococcales bacterium]|nr:hypothetical protein [Myxococcales bacterium]